MSNVWILLRVIDMTGNASGVCVKSQSNTKNQAGRVKLKFFFGFQLHAPLSY